MGDKEEIFIGIPCYNTGEKLLATLQSVQNQQFKNFKAVIAIEPTDNAERTIEIAQHIAAQDNRFIVKINETRLGWAGNVKQLMEDVDCPYFTILPHDDILHENHLLLLHKAIMEHPEIIIAFPNIYFFGACDGVQEGPGQQGDLAERLINHFSCGESSEFWRGLTRSSILDANTAFPASDVNSFAAEYEWATILLTKGRSLFVKEAFYYKRIYTADEENSVSTEWNHKYSEQKLFKSLAAHKKRMCKIIKKLPFTKKEMNSTLLALDAALLWKVLHFSTERFCLPDSEIKHLAKLKKKFVRESGQHPPIIQHRIILCDLLNQFQQNKIERLESQLLSIIEVDPQNIDAQILLMKIYLRQNNLSKALPQLNTLTALFPNSWRIREVSNWLSDSLKNRFQYE